MTQQNKEIIDCYDKTAEKYADKFMDELSHKHLDCILLQSFAEENSEAGRCIDLGCGPGQTTRYLKDNGIRDLLGVDISSGMIATAQKINPPLLFEVADMLDLKYTDQSFGSAIAFYSIVHFDYKQIEKAFLEIARILKSSGQFLFSFHIGDTILHLDNFLEQEVNIDFYFYDVSTIVNLLTASGFEIIDVIERRPYKDVEYVSNRAYIWASKI